MVLALPNPILHTRTTPSLFPRSFTPTLARRQSCVDTCGSTCYWQEDIDAAVQKGFSLYQSGDTLGDNDYPHEFDDREGFDISVSGPWYEFPILSSYKVYSGGSPGADRVVFNDVSISFQSSIVSTRSPPYFVSAVVFVHSWEWSCLVMETLLAYDSSCIF